MQTYICYVHTRGAFLPNVRLVKADNEDQASVLLVAGLRHWPALLTIEVLEIFDQDHASLHRMRVDCKAPVH